MRYVRNAVKQRYYNTQADVGLTRRIITDDGIAVLVPRKKGFNKPRGSSLVNPRYTY